MKGFLIRLSFYVSILTAPSRKMTPQDERNRVKTDKVKTICCHGKKFEFIILTLPIMHLV